MKKWLGYGWIILGLSACTLKNPEPTDHVCLVTEIVRYQQENTDQPEVSRQTFSYNSGQLSTYSEKKPNRSIFFKFKYVGGKVATAYTPDETIVLSLDYDEFERIEKASYIVNNKEQTVFSLFYESNDRSVRLVRLVETRVLLPTNSFIASRTFQFTYRNIDGKTEDLVSQTVQNGYKDGSRTEEELTFEQSALNHSPYYDSGQKILIALLALTNHTESNVAPYLQRTYCKSFTRQVIAVDGTISRSESNHFTTDFDGYFNPIHSTLLTRTSFPTDSSLDEKRYQETFQYNCIE